MEIDELNAERARLFKNWDDLENVIHILEATANTYYSPNEGGWKKLLTARDKLKPFIEKEIIKIQNQVDKVDIKIKNTKDDGAI